MVKKEKDPNHWARERNLTLAQALHIAKIEKLLIAAYYQLGPDPKSANLKADIWSLYEKGRIGFGRKRYATVTP